MPTNHTVAQGECLSSIAHQYGFTSKTIWEDPGNEDLRKKRKTPTILSVGDIVVIPDKQPKAVKVATGGKHTFRRKVQTVKLRVRFLNNDKPIANEPFDLVVDGESQPSGTTDGDGTVEADVEPTAIEAIITFPKRKETHTMHLGHMDPVDDPTGVQARLHQLGYYRGKVDGEMGTLAISALKAFQKKNNLPETGEPNDKTKAALVKAYGQ